MNNFLNSGIGINSFVIERITQFFILFAVSVFLEMAFAFKIVVIPSWMITQFQNYFPIVLVFGILALTCLCYWTIEKSLNEIDNPMR